MLKLITGLSLCTLPLLADDDTSDPAKDDKKAHSVLPVLRVLPAGSILKDVSIPRYNPDYTPASILIAKQLKIVSKQQIIGSKVEITLFDEFGNATVNTKLNSVDYNQSKGLLQSNESLLFSADTFQISSQGVVLDWDNQRGFFLGKNQTMFYLKESVSMKDTTKNSQTEALDIVTKKKASKSQAALAAAAAASLASTPTILSAEDLAYYDRLAQPSTAHIQQIHTQTSAEISKSKEAATKADEAKASLTKMIGVIPAPKANQADPGELKPIEGKANLSIKSDGVMFFDANKGIMVFSDNVTLTHPKYTFTCEGELKVILKKKPKPADDKSKDPKKINKPNERFGDISQIIATKNVLLKSVDNKGNPIVARAGRLIYNHTTGAIVLQGLNSRITTVDKQIKITKKDGNITIDKDYHVSGKGTQLDFNVEDLKNNAR